MAKSEYEEVEVLRDDDGVIAVITKRVPNGFLSFALMKEYERDGQIIRSSFLGRRHCEGARRLLARVETWIDTEVDRAVARRSAESAVRRAESAS